VSLTPVQKEVVEATEGHYVVLAGPGCGKTHTITEKILYIFEKEAIPEPYGLLAVTFTDVAARTMRARLRSKGFKHWNRVWVGTFHSFGRHILQCYGGDVGIREDFDIVESNMRSETLTELTEKHDTGIPPSDLGSAFERLKRNGIYPGQGDSSLAPNIQGAYREYNEILRDVNLVDFGDLIALTVRLLQESNHVKRLYSGFFRYVIVDEFQDTDKQQLEMVRLMAERAMGSTIVGDDDQSIFGWRGALRENVYRIKELLDSTEIVLGQNFRSDEVIVEAAAKVIGFDLDRRDKDIQPVSNRRGNLYKYEFDIPDNEAKQVVKWISGTLSTNEVEDPGCMAVIARARYRAQWTTDEMDKAGVPWFDQSRLGFKEAWETTLGLSIIELAHEPDSSLYLYKVMKAVEEGGLAFRLGDIDALDVAIGIRDRLKDPTAIDLDPLKVDVVLDIAGLSNTVREASAGESDARRRMKNVEAMTKDIAAEASTRRIDLLRVVNRFSGQGAVQIISGHQSKGGEFDIVFFIGLEDDVLPDYRSHDDESRLSEERRIFYVGLTRAKRSAYLTSVSTRRWWGGVRQAVPSRFIGHIPAEYFSVVNIQHTQEQVRQIPRFLSS
jgi:DNA helicase-2/ATP-dependent DNA helicase PcrA